MHMSNKSIYKEVDALILSNDFSLFYSCSVINFFYLIRAFLLKEFSLLYFEANISRNKRTTFDAHQCLVKRQERLYGK